MRRITIIFALYILPFIVKAQNAPFYIWGGGLDGSVYQKTAIYSDVTNGLLVEAPKDAGNNKLPIELNWRGGGISPLYIKPNGNIGFGTNSPGGNYHFKSSAGQTSMLLTSGASQGSLLRFERFGAPGEYFTMETGAGTYDDFRIFSSSWSTPIFALKPNGNVGIGTASPASILDVRGGNISVVNSGYTFAGRDAAPGNDSYIYTRRTPNFQILGSNRNGTGSLLKLGFAVGGGDNEADVKMTINTNGYIGIGTNDPDSKLTVNGNIHAKEVKVDLDFDGPDYVFEENYPLRSLKETKTFIEQHKHLPGIPSSDEMQQNGVNLLEMNMKLLEKVEELTLHLIRLQNEVDQLKSERK